MPSKNVSWVTKNVNTVDKKILMKWKWIFWTILQSTGPNKKILRVQASLRAVTVTVSWSPMVLVTWQSWRTVSLSQSPTVLRSPSPVILTMADQQQQRGATGSIQGELLKQWTVFRNPGFEKCLGWREVKVYDRLLCVNWIWQPDIISWWFLAPYSTWFPTLFHILIPPSFLFFPWQDRSYIKVIFKFSMMVVV